MKKSISVLLSMCLMCPLLPAFAESLKASDVIGKMEFKDPEGIYLSDDEIKKTVPLSDIEYIALGDGIGPSDGDEDAAYLYDFKKELKEKDLRTVKLSFLAETAVSGLKLWDGTDSVKAGSIYGSEDGESFFLLGKLNLNGEKVFLTDFGFNVKVKSISVVTEGAGSLKISELHVIKENESYETVDIASSGGGLYYKNEPDKWTVSADTEHRLSPAKNMFDGKTETFWHSDYDDETVESKKKLPHSVTVNFNEDKVISGVRLTPRNGESRITVADIYVSGDGKNFYKAGRGAFSYASPDEKTVDFGENVLVRAVKMVSVATEGNTYSTCAELEFKKADMSYSVSDMPDEMTPSVKGKLTADINGEENDCLTDGRLGSYVSAGEGDVLTLRSKSPVTASGIRIKTREGKPVTAAKISLSADGKNFIDYAEHSLSGGEYLFRANITLRAVKISVKGEETAEITEVSLISECFNYNKTEIDKEIRDTALWTVTAGSENASSPAKNLIDGDIHSIWHSYYDNAKGEKDTPPIEIVFDFGKEITLSGFNYYPMRRDTDADTAGYFKAIKVDAAVDPSPDARWYPVAADRYTYSGYFAVQTTHFDFNTKVRKLKITVMDANYSYATGGEIRFLSEDAARKPENAKAKEAFSVFEFDDWESTENVKIAYDLNDAGFLKGFYTSGEAVNKDYYTVEDDGIILSKYFFTDCLPDMSAADIGFNLSFFRGDDIYYTVKVGGAERHKLFFRSVGGGKVYAIAGGREISSGDEVRRKDSVIAAAVASDGYRLKSASVTAINDAYDYFDIARDKYTVTASSVFPSCPESMMTDSDSSTYWHSGYEVSGGTIVSSDKPPFDITVSFNEITDGVKGIRYVPRRDNDGGRIVSYKVYISHDGENFEKEAASGTLINSPGEQSIDFSSPVDSVKAVRLKIIQTSGGTYAQIAELNVVGAKKKSAEITSVSNGTKRSEFSVNDLFADLEFTAEFEKISEGITPVEYEFSHVAYVTAPENAENGKDLFVSFKAEEGYRLSEPAVYAGESLLSPDADYTFVTEDGKAELTVKNPDGRRIKICASGVSVLPSHKVSYKDKFGAVGALPEDAEVKEGEKFTLPSGKGLKLVGYVFDGWTEDGEHYNAGDTVTMRDGDMVFYASWKADKGKKDESGAAGKPSAKPSGKSSSSSGAPTVYVPEKEKVYKVYLSGTGYVTFNNGDKVENPREIPGYKFDGWYMDEALTVPYSNTGVTGPLMLYPKYTKLQSDEPFEDIIGHWAYGDILYLYGKNIVKGTREGGFSPDAYVTRAEFIMMLYNISGSDSDLQDVFKDVSKDDWFFKAAVWAYAAGITAGTDKESFSPYEKLSREQAVTMLARYMKLSDADAKEDGKEIFADYDEISDYAKNAVSTAVREGIVLGRTDHKFAPLENTTRAECAVILGRVMRKS